MMLISRQDPWYPPNSGIILNLSCNIDLTDVSVANSDTRYCFLQHKISRLIKTGNGSPASKVSRENTSLISQRAPLTRKVIEAQG